MTSHEIIMLIDNTLASYKQGAAICDEPIETLKYEAGILSLDSLKTHILEQEKFERLASKNK